jgi:phosphoribosylanthranilate isomerase
MICGSRNERDIELLVGEGVDAVGLITEVWQAVPCNLARQQARNLASRVPPLVSTVLIITEERLEEICRLADYIRPDAVQIHGFVSPEDILSLKEKLPVKIIKTLHLRGERAAENNGPEQQVREYLHAGADAILLDSSSKDKVGCTGLTADFGLARRLRNAAWPRPFILAGGLHAGNVAEAIQKVHPYGIDVFTGVTRQGSLDPRAVREFIQTVRQSGE